MNEESTSSTIFRDLVLAIALFMTVLVIVMLPHVNPKATRSSQDVLAPGNLIVTMTWPNGPDDVDLWVTGPGERRAVGFNHPKGVLWDLLRDDTGLANDTTGTNFENAFTRGLVAGTYAINVHCYRCGSQLPIRVQVEVSMKRADGTLTRLFMTTVVLRRDCQELTVARFDISRKGVLVDGSVNRVFVPISGATCVVRTRGDR